MFVAIADIHLGLTLDCKTDSESGLPTKTKEAVRALYKVGKFCDLNKALLLVAGDVFEKSNPQPMYERLWIKFLNKLDEKGVQARIIAGNHDVSKLSDGALKPFAEYKFKNIKFYNDVGAEVIDGINFIFAPYIPKAVSANPDEYITEKASELVIKGHKNIIVCHHVFEGAVWNNQVDESFADANQRFGSVEGIDLIISGHIHKRQALKQTDKSTVYYTGSLIQNDVTERGEKKGFLVFDKKTLQPSFQPIKSHEYVKLTVTDAEFVGGLLKQEFCDHCLEAVKDKIVHISVEVSRENYDLKQFSALEDEIKKICYYHAKTAVNVIDGLEENEVDLESVDIKGLINETIDGLSASGAVKKELKSLSDEIYNKTYEAYSESLDE